MMAVQLMDWGLGFRVWVTPAIFAREFNPRAFPVLRPARDPADQDALNPKT